MSVNESIITSMPVYMSLEEWKAEMTKVAPKPKVNHYYVCNNNLYVRYKIPEGNKNAGRHTWRRLNGKETLEVYLDSTFGNQSVEDWLKYITDMPCDIDINTIDH